MERHVLVHSCGANPLTLLFLTKFLHQLLVDQRTTHGQQHHQEYKGQDDACHSAWGQARWVWVLACDEYPLIAVFFFLEMVTLRQLLLGTEEPGGGFVSIHRVEGDEVATLLLPT